MNVLMFLKNIERLTLTIQISFTYCIWKLLSSPKFFSSLKKEVSDFYSKYNVRTESKLKTV